jgi:hypothetical protein
MKSQKLLRVLMSSAVFLMAGAVQAQMATPSTPTPRGEPASRIQIKMERDEFLRNNRWTNQGGWMPRQTPANASTMSRAQMRADTARFKQTHEWDEVSATWKEKAPRKPMR